jgi:hypothetical protein
MVYQRFMRSMLVSPRTVMRFFRMKLVQKEFNEVDQRVDI